MLAAQKIQHDHAAMFTWLSGDLQRVATECRAPADADRDSLVFVGDADQYILPLTIFGINSQTVIKSQAQAQSQRLDRRRICRA